MSNVWVVGLVAFGQAVQEIFMRQTVDLRDKWMSLHVRRWPAERVEEVVGIFTC